jgi:hypothetical protein
MENLIYLIFLFIIFEFFLILIVKILKKEFKWLINSDDELPKFPYKKLHKFYKDSYDSLLGWDRKKNSSGFELGEKKTFFKISKDGYRGCSKHKKTAITVFGDSFAFCRYVNDEQTWQSHLEKKLKKNVYNYGVGNYGLDQSYLKFLKYKKEIKSKIVIFNVVPETIARINSYWKHYREFGNIMGFKPLYNFENNKLFLTPNFLKKKFTETEIHKNIFKVKKIDQFYQIKFLKNKLTFPYSFKIFKNFNYFSNILINLILRKITNKKKFYAKAASIVLKQNIKESHKMYNNPKYTEKLKSMIFFLNENLKKDNLQMVLVISPQLLDFTEGNYIDVSKFYSEIGKKVPCLNLHEKFKNIKFQRYYFKDIYGGHLNEKGNKFISKIIFNFLKRYKIL